MQSPYLQESIASHLEAHPSSDRSSSVDVVALAAGLIILPLILLLLSVVLT